MIASPAQAVHVRYLQAVVAIGLAHQTATPSLRQLDRSLQPSTFLVNTPRPCYRKSQTRRCGYGIAPQTFPALEAKPEMLIEPGPRLRRKKIPCRAPFLTTAAGMHLPQLQRTPDHGLSIGLEIQDSKTLCRPLHAIWSSMTDSECWELLSVSIRCSIFSFHKTEFVIAPLLSFNCSLWCLEVNLWLSTILQMQIDILHCTGSPREALITSEFEI